MPASILPSAASFADRVFIHPGRDSACRSNIGVAQWKGVRLADILERAGITADAVDVMPAGLDPEYVTGGVNYGHVRRPVAKALDDVILAYEMNGRPLPPDNGFPLRFICPSWIGVANVKWVGSIEVSATPLQSYWNTLAYRLFGPTYPTDGVLITRQTVKSSFELEWNGTLDGWEIPWTPPE
jgi:DMSO/TMAO reductase YedYZ molybdopterin-dependent catalytic subunit